MSYRFRRDDRTVRAAVRRVALEEIGAALDETRDPALGVEDRVHQCRKRCKKLRGLLRLVRPGFDGYVLENAAFRDAAALLAGVRDQDVLIETCDHVSVHHGDKADRPVATAIRQRLIEARRASSDEAGLEERLERFRQAMEAARTRAGEWDIGGEEFAAFAPGLRVTIARARRAMRAARDDPAPHAMHEWRKWVKYHWYHARLLQGIWPGPMAAHVAAAGELADLLGRHHDLCVLQSTLAEQPGHYGDPDGVRAFAALAARQEKSAARAAFRKGALLLAERPRALTRRWGAYWTCWRGKA